MVEGGTTCWSWKCPYCGSVFIWLWYRDLSLNIFQQNIFSSKLLQHNLGSIFPSTIFFILDTNYYWPPRQPRWGKRNKYYFSLLEMSSRVWCEGATEKFCLWEFVWRQKKLAAGDWCSLIVVDESWLRSTGGDWPQDTVLLWSLGLSINDVIKKWYQQVEKIWHEMTMH